MGSGEVKSGAGVFSSAITGATIVSTRPIETSARKRRNNFCGVCTCAIRLAKWRRGKRGRLDRFLISIFQAYRPDNQLDLANLI